MRRFLPRRPRRWTRWILSSALVASLVPGQPRPIAAEEIVLVSEPLVRKFPEFTFCPLPVTLAFTASGGTATIFIVANTYVFDGASFIYTHQAIDDVSVVRDSVNALFQLVNDESSPFNFCYLGATVPSIFEFDQLAPGTPPLLETFESAPSGWDLDHGAYYDGTRSGPNNPSSPSPTFGTGSLGLGIESATPSLADSGRTSITVTGLIGGKGYVLNGWWSVDGGISTDNASLTVKITGPDQTPLAQKTWGALKARYR